MAAVRPTPATNPTRAAYVVSAVWASSQAASNPSASSVRNSMIRFLGCIDVADFGLNTRNPPGAVADEELGLVPMLEGNKKSPPLSPIAEARFPTVTLSSGSVLIPIVANGVARWAIDDQTNM